MNPHPKASVSGELHKALAQEATFAAGQAYAPYSKYRVGAAVLGASGAIYRGANVENSSFGLSICAERVALATARVAGENKVVAIAIACIDSRMASSIEEKVPCGACRQWIQELAPDAQIIIVGEDQSYSIDQLLPRPFTLRR